MISVLPNLMNSKNLNQMVKGWPHVGAASDMYRKVEQLKFNAHHLGRQRRLTNAVSDFPVAYGRLAFRQLYGLVRLERKHVEPHLGIQKGLPF